MGLEVAGEGKVFRICSESNRGSSNPLASHYTHYIIPAYFFCYDATAPIGQGIYIIEASRSHSDTPYSVGFLWTSDLHVAKTSI